MLPALGVQPQFEAVAADLADLQAHKEIRASLSIAPVYTVPALGAQPELEPVAAGLTDLWGALGDGELVNGSP